jgi:hypothetical protein
MRKIYCCAWSQAALFLLFSLPGICQTLEGLLPLADADSAYVRRFVRKNDFRLFYGVQGNNLSLGSTRDGASQVNGDLYKNTNDYIGAGISYGLLDGDLSFAIPGTTYLQQERSTLTQFKLGLSYTRRKIVLRGFYSESTGVVVSGSDDEFESTPSVQDQRFGLQITLLFNPLKYSYRAAIYQSEYQIQTAGSFLIRFDPFYRRLGTSDATIIPAAYDTAPRFGQQTGLEYVQSPGLLVLPGYGINIAVGDSRFFISPIVFAGLGFAHNMYKTTAGRGSFTSIEYAANAVLNTGYNGTRCYAKLQVNWTSGYTSMDPTYLTNSNLTCLVMVGMRFRDLKVKNSAP